MKTINVYQSELNKEIPLEYIGKVIYIGASGGYGSLTNKTKYNIVKDDMGDIKVVDDSEEDYLYDLMNPRPTDNSSSGGKFYYIDDPDGILANVGVEEYNN
ncbi:MAG: hypothetical protein SOZ22_00105 [Ezakiella sp.]|nr:hypothetical protein [Ezakiella sp.]